MLGQKKTLKDSSLVCLEDLQRALALLVDYCLHRFMSYKKLKEYIRFCIVNYEDLSENDKEYLSKYFFGNSKREQNEK